MTLPLGTWTLNANGRQLTLIIRGIDKGGKLDLLLQGSSVVGSWDAKTRQVLFQVHTDDGCATGGQFKKTFVGFLLELNQNQSKEVPILAGYFDYQRENGPHDPNTRKSFGWYAQLVLRERTAAFSQLRPHRRTSAFATHPLV